MADLEVTTQESRINPAENLEGWLNKRKDAEPAQPEPSKAEASPAEPTVAEPAKAAQPVIDWREVVLPEDVDHGFFRGKKVPQVIESYKHAERAKQEAERKAAELERRLAAIEQQPKPVSQPAPSDDAEIANLWFTDPKAAEKLVRERAIAEARTAAQEELTKFRQETFQENQKQVVLKKGGDAYDTAREALKLTPEVWNLRAGAVMLHLTDPNSPLYKGEEGLFDPNAYKDVHNAIFGEPVAPVVVKPAPEPPPPPGAKKPASASVSESSSSPISREQSDARKQLAAIAGIDPEKLLARQRARQKEK